jgi:hypothetical protein
MANLDSYIQKLLIDDEALSQFIQNPLVSETKAGLTKAERSVLRRVLLHLPATSKSGFSGARTASSFRRSLRLIQNVLHHSSTAIHSNMLSATSNAEAAVLPDAVSQNGGVFYMFVYYPNGGSNDYTCKTNSAVDSNGGPYANYRYFQIVFGDGPTSVERLLLGASQAFPNNISYQTGGNSYVTEITIDGNAISADLSNSCYDLPNPNADNAFWFYSINGRANFNNSGKDGQSFRNYPLNSGDTVFWQLIAPDQKYGFQPCV